MHRRAESQRPLEGSRNARSGTLTGVRVLVVADCDVTSLGFRILLSRASWVERCMTARGLDDATVHMGRYVPHVVVLDLERSDGAGVTLATAVRGVAPKARMMMLSTGSVSHATVERCGAAAVLPKHTTLDRLIWAVQHVAGGGTYFRKASSGSHRLSPRECDVLALMIDGATNTEIAERLDLSPYTVKQHAAAIYRKLDVRNRTEAVSRASDLGLVMRQRTGSAVA